MKPPGHPSMPEGSVPGPQPDPAPASSMLVRWCVAAVAVGLLTGIVVGVVALLH